MKAIKISKNLNVKKIDNMIEEGYDLILDFGKKSDPERIQKILSHFDKKFGIEVSLRHPELEEVIESGLIGGISGAGLGILASMVYGGPIGILAGLGASLGTIVGVMSVTLNIKIYQYRGHTMLKITQ